MLNIGRLLQTRAALAGTVWFSRTLWNFGPTNANWDYQVCCMWRFLTTVQWINIFEWWSLCPLLHNCVLSRLTFGNIFVMSQRALMGWWKQLVISVCVRERERLLQLVGVTLQGQFKGVQTDTCPLVATVCNFILHISFYVIDVKLWGPNLDHSKCTFRL